MHKQPEVRRAEPVVHQEFNSQPDPADYTYIGELPQEEPPQRKLSEIRQENEMLRALQINKALRQTL